MTTNIPGSAVLRKTITDQCRRNHGTAKVAKIVSEAVRSTVDDLMRRDPPSKGWKFHVVVTAERPDPKATPLDPSLDREIEEALNENKI